MNRNSSFREENTAALVRKVISAWRERYENDAHEEALVEGRRISKTPRQLSFNFIDNDMSPWL